LEQFVKINDTRFGKNPEAEFIDRLMKKELYSNKDILNRDRLKSIEKFDLFNQNHKYSDLVDQYRDKISELSSSEDSKLNQSNKLLTFDQM